jgi:hypothetical protein
MCVIMWSLHHLWRQDILVCLRVYISLEIWPSISSLTATYRVPDAIILNFNHCVVVILADTLKLMEAGSHPLKLSLSVSSTWIMDSLVFVCDFFQSFASSLQPRLRAGWH